ncbi:hypothetical protein POM88_021785 [Heracleum sosnowskyi]|uniref:Uncharacterized protein n=1 Tax=Heracleum sosnowskyi TaxID=360622 RepID=A0AAD8IE34_9APIA|nr:hypothetical protein POM88_021785 [Heracleum sosnowskyi]
MDGSEKKRKKSEMDNLDGGGRRMKKEATTTTTPPPTEEEVDEFFTILNRMRATVKYLKNNKSSNTNKVGDTVFRALEIPAPPDDVTVDVKVTDNNCVLDLNSIPDGDGDQLHDEEC